MIEVCPYCYEDKGSVVCWPPEETPEWVICEEHKRALKVMLNSQYGLTRVTMEKPYSTMLNKHGEYVVKYARNHGLSISEAHQAPMVQAHLAYCNAVSANRDLLSDSFDSFRYGIEGLLRSATDD